MYEQIERPKGNKSRAVANSVSQKKSNAKQGFGFVDNRAEAVTQKKLQEMANNSPCTMQLKAFQDIPNNSLRLQANQAAQLQAMADYVKANKEGRSPSGSIVQREVINGTRVVIEGGYATFSLDGKKYHINEGDPKHVTCDSEGRMHYYFKGEGEGIEDRGGALVL